MRLIRILMVAAVIGGASVVMADDFGGRLEAILRSEPLIDIQVERVSGDALSFDLRGASPQAAHTDVLRALFRTAEALKDERFSEVRLGYQGETRYVLPGQAFHAIGQEWGWQNPVYVIRTLPEQVLTPDGRPASERWTGGMIGVLGAQMDDVNRMADRWYREDVIAGLPR